MQSSSITFPIDRDLLPPWKEGVFINKYPPRRTFPSLSTQVIDREVVTLPTIVDNVESVFNVLEDNYCEIRNKFEVRSFLLNQPITIQYLWEVLSKVFEYFGYGQKTALELVFDPEIENDFGELFLNIITNLDPEEALKKLDKIDEEWFVPIVSQNALNFNLNLEFV